jgi:hypothetical protein
MTISRLLGSKKFALLGTLFVGSMMFVARPANAAPAFVQLDSVLPVGGGLFQWNYRLELTASEALVTGDFFTVQDFGEYVAGSVSSTNLLFTPSTQLVGPNVANVTPSDDPGEINLVWTYNGPTIVDGVYNGFSALSRTNIARSDQYTAQTTDAFPPTTGKIGSIGPVTVPIRIPEPASIVFAGIGVVGLLGSIRRRKG